VAGRVGRPAHREAENVERGTFVLPSEDEAELFRLLGDLLPFFLAGRQNVRAWLRDQEGGP